MLEAMRSKQSKAGHLTYLANVSNELSRKFYMKQGATVVDDALELGHLGSEVTPVLMTTRYCIRYQLGLCGQRMEPLFLRSSDGRVFPLRFNCKECKMQVMAPEKR